MKDVVFFYGTLMRAFGCARTALDRKLKSAGPRVDRGHVVRPGDLPGSHSSSSNRVWGDVHEILDPIDVLRTLDEIEGFKAGEPETSLYRRKERPVTLEDGEVAFAWVYFYNASRPGRAHRSGDYLEVPQIEVMAQTRC
jgi:gamma-glutamylcyclotransferase (GGCT)/AIG2-like uncharacterized protein YtfP